MDESVNGGDSWIVLDEGFPFSRGSSRASNGAASEPLLGASRGDLLGDKELGVDAGEAGGEAGASGHGLDVEAEAGLCTGEPASAAFATTFAHELLPIRRTPDGLRAALSMGLECHDAFAQAEQSLNLAVRMDGVDSRVMRRSTRVIEAIQRRKLFLASPFSQTTASSAGGCAGCAGGAGGGGPYGAPGGSDEACFCANCHGAPSASTSRLGRQGANADAATDADANADADADADADTDDCGEASAADAASAAVDLAAAEAVSARNLRYGGRAPPILGALAPRASSLHPSLVFGSTATSATPDVRRTDAPAGPKLQPSLQMPPPKRPKQGKHEPQQPLPQDSDAPTDVAGPKEGSSLSSSSSSFSSSFSSSSLPSPSAVERRRLRRELRERLAAEQRLAPWYTRLQYSSSVVPLMLSHLCTLALGILIGQRFM